MHHFTKAIAKTLKDSRQARAWSLDKTAAATGVSKAMLGQIERGESSPTIATLWKIANGLELTFSQFINQSTALASPPTPYGANSQDIQVKPLLAYDPILGTESFMIEIKAAHEHLSKPHMTGVYEQVLTLEHPIEIFFENQWQSLEPFSACYFCAHQQHGYRNANEHTAIFYNVIYYLND